MRYRTLGSDTTEVSCVGYGGMHLSIDGRPDASTAIGTIHAGLDHGITLIDTADVYCLDDQDIGHNERLIGKAVAEWQGDRDRITIATKGGLTRPEGRWVQNGRPEHLHEACESSLRALGVERIDLYQLHAPDPEVPLSDSIGALAQLQNQGKIRWIGISNVSVAEIEKASGTGEIKCVQNRLNPFFREAVESGVAQYCDSNGIAFLAYSPVGGGRLNKKLPRHDVVAPLAEKYQTTAHAIVLAWVLAQGENVIVIPSARSAANVVNSTTAAHIELADEDLDNLTAAHFSTARD